MIAGTPVKMLHATIDKMPSTRLVTLRPDFGADADGGKGWGSFIRFVCRWQDALTGCP